MPVQQPARVRPGANNNEKVESLETEIESLKVSLEECEKRLTEAVGAILDAIPRIEDALDTAIIDQGEYLGRKFE